MSDLIEKLFRVLNLIKGFTAGYSTDSFQDGYMLIDYEGKRFAVKIVEIKNPSENASEDIKKLKWLV